MILSATVDDLPWLSQFGHLFTDQPNVVSGFSPLVWVSTWSSRIGRGSGVVLFAEEDGEFAGALGAVLGASPVDGVITAEEKFWFVPPEKRGHGGQLLRVFEEWAMRSGAKRLWITRLEGEERKARALDRLYGRRGYERRQVSFCKEVG